jgi:hypothetical protein
MTPLSERLAQLRARLAALRQLAHQGPSVIPHIRAIREEDGFAYIQPFDPYSLNPPIPPEALESIERELGARLPESFRRFLLVVGDGGHAGPFPDWNLASVAAAGLEKSHIAGRLAPEVIPASVQHPLVEDVLYEEQLLFGEACPRTLTIPGEYVSEFGLIIEGPLAGQLYLRNSDEPVRESGSDIIDVFDKWIDRKLKSLRQREQRCRELHEVVPEDATALREAAFRLYSEPYDFEGGPQAARQQAARQQAARYLRQALVFKTLPLDVLTRDCERLEPPCARATRGVGTRGPGTIPT